MKTHEEVKNLLKGHLLGTLTEQEEKELERWKTLDRHNRDLYERISSSNFIQQAVMDASHKEAVNSWKRIRHSIGYRYSIVGKKFWAAAVSVAAIMAIAFVCSELITSDPEFVIHAGKREAKIYYNDGKAVAVYNQQQYVSAIRHEKKVNEDITFQYTLAVPRGADYSVVLEDSTSIYVNSQSTLTIPSDFSSTKRILHLYGEAYFDVKSDSLHPFVIHTDQASVEVKGTRFDVKNYDDFGRMTVTLEEGVVELKTFKHRARLMPGQQASIGRDGSIAVEDVNTDLYCAWHQNRISYFNETLETILTDLSRWYGFDVTYKNDKLKELRFSMELDKTIDFNEVARKLEKIERVRILIGEGNKVVVKE